MWRLTALVGLVMSLVGIAVLAQEQTGSGSSIVLNGVPVSVRWSDGDSFRILDGEHQGRGVRLMGYNSLESYGPVHRWGQWQAEELYALAREAHQFGRSQTWTCTTEGATDNYDRLLIACDDLTLAMVSRGLGFLFYVESTPPAEQVEAQAAAQREGLGIWAKGVPDHIVSSLHSADEGGEIYNRVVSTSTGMTEQLQHAETYTACQEVCLLDSCLVYVPFSQRYGAGRAACLRTAGLNEGTAQGSSGSP